MTTPAPRHRTSATPHVGRRLLTTTAGGIGLAGTHAGRALADPAPTTTTARGRAFRDRTTFEWLGAAGWRVRTPTTTVLVDPYLTRFDTGLASGTFDKGTSITLDTTRIDDALGPPDEPRGSVDAILVTHTHWDHFADVPHIAKTRGSTVFTTLTGYHLGRAMGLPVAQIAVVKGNEELHVGDTAVRVVGSLHSRTGNGGLLFPGVRTQVPEPPQTIADMPEGNTLGFLIRGSDRVGGVLLLGASDYDDQALRGLEVEAVALPLPSNDVTVDYVERLLRVLEMPRTVVLVHWDNFETPLRNPPGLDETTRVRIRSTTAAIKRVSPRTRVLEPTYLAPMHLP